MRIIEPKEIPFTELILPIDVSSSNEKIAFGIAKSCIATEIEDANAALSWEKLKKKYDPVSASSLVKMERMSRASRLSKNEIRRYGLIIQKIYKIKLEIMESSMIDDQFIVQVLNSLTGDYELQMLLLQERIGVKYNPLSIDLKEELN